jgi:hypothetical protein
MVHQIISIFLFLICFSVNAQQYLAKDGTISFFSKAPVEDISAINNKVSAVYDAKTKALVFQLHIIDFIFSRFLMQEHFNENYMESDIFPISTFVGKVISHKEGVANVEGELTIHGETNIISVTGDLQVNDNIASISAVRFSVKLEEIEIKVTIEMKKQ